ncbi:MAG TPA: hypothetical protein VIW78_15200, partial [Burkholderiales bacterium]
DTPNVNTGNAFDTLGRPLCQITPINGQSMYDLNDLILDVQRVRISDTDLYLREVGTKDAQPGGPYAMSVLFIFMSPGLCSSEVPEHPDSRARSIAAAGREGYWTKVQCQRCRGNGSRVNDASVSAEAGSCLQPPSGFRPAAAA